jgi:hypothetical protein
MPDAKLDVDVGKQGDRDGACANSTAQLGQPFLQLQPSLDQQEGQGMQRHHASSGVTDSIAVSFMVVVGYQCHGSRVLIIIVISATPLQW